MKDKIVVYFASPYTVTGLVESEDKRTKLHDRWVTVTKALAELQLRYYDTHVFFGPITHSHPMSLYMPHETNCFEFWVEGIDHYFVKRCDEVWVLTDAGWSESRGVAAEVLLAGQLKKQVRLVDTETYEVVPYVGL